MRLVFDLDELGDELDAETQDILEDIANTLVNELTREAPTGATADLQRSFQIFRRSSGEIVLGSRLQYAEFVQTGTRPHTPPFEPIAIWSRRNSATNRRRGLCGTRYGNRGLTRTHTSTARLRIRCSHSGK